MLNIQKKIEAIRQKPEHIRMRYVWVMVAISMFFIIIIWLISLSSMKNDSDTQSDWRELKTSVENIAKPKETKNPEGFRSDNSANPMDRSDGNNNTNK
jgi:Na+/H+ antiporter NhaC